MKGPIARGSKEKPGYSHYLSQSQPTGHSTCPHTSCANVPAASHGKVKGCAPILSSNTNDEFKNHSVSCWGGKRLIRLFVPSLRSVGKTLTYCWLPTDTVWGEPLPEQKQESGCALQLWKLKTSHQTQSETAAFQECHSTLVKYHRSKFGSCLTSSQAEIIKQRLGTMFLLH